MTSFLEVMLTTAGAAESTNPEILSGKAEAAFKPKDNPVIKILIKLIFFIFIFCPFSFFSSMSESFC